MNDDYASFDAATFVASPSPYNNTQHTPIIRSPHPSGYSHQILKSPHVITTTRQETIVSCIQETEITHQNLLYSTYVVKCPNNECISYSVIRDGLSYGTCGACNQPFHALTQPYVMKFNLGDNPSDAEIEANLPSSTIDITCSYCGQKKGVDSKADMFVCPNCNYLTLKHAVRIPVNNEGNPLTDSQRRQHLLGNTTSTIDARQDNIVPNLRQLTSLQKASMQIYRPFHE